MVLSGRVLESVMLGLRALVVVAVAAAVVVAVVVGGSEAEVAQSS